MFTLAYDVTVPINMICAHNTHVKTVIVPLFIILRRTLWNTRDGDTHIQQERLRFRDDGHNKRQRVRRWIDRQRHRIFRSTPAWICEQLRRSLSGLVASTPPHEWRLLRRHQSGCFATVRRCDKGRVWVMLAVDQLYLLRPPISGRKLLVWPNAVNKWPLLRITNCVEWVSNPCDEIYLDFANMC